MCINMAQIDYLRGVYILNLGNLTFTVLEKLKQKSFRLIHEMFLFTASMYDL